VDGVRPGPLGRRRRSLRDAGGPPRGRRGARRSASRTPWRASPSWSRGSPAAGRRPRSAAPARSPAARAASWRGAWPWWGTPRDRSTRSAEPG
jgi:hypothetical protein